MTQVVMGSDISEEIPAATFSQSVEFFHIYTDETINENHRRSIEYVKSLNKIIGDNASHVVFIDNYNPKKHTLSAQEVLDFLDSQDVKPDFWAYEADVVENAKSLLRSVTKPHLQRSYEKYIATHHKLPCSLLTAAWYLTRLGVFDSDFIKSTRPGRRFGHVDRLINILPEMYVPVEKRALEIIQHSPHANHIENINDVFYDTSEGRAATLF